MRMFTKFATSSAAAVVAMGVSVAHAEEPENIDSPPKETTEVAQGTVNVTTDGTRPAARGGTDHSQFVGKFAVGYLGIRTMGVGTAAGGGPAQTVEAPVIGVRYWLDSFMGIDAGLGFSTGGGETEVDVAGTSATTDVSAPFGFILHAGLPLAFADSDHFVFQVVPELNFGLASNTLEGDPDDTDLSGTHLDIGARAGAEIHFGFIDIPQLSLQGGVGVRIAFDSTKTETGDDSASSSFTSISTGVGDNPWNIFTANIAALYYFDM